MNETVFIPHTVIADTLAVPPTPGKNLLDPFKTLARDHRLPFNILEDVAQANPSRPELHRLEGDVWYCIQGEAIFRYGGKLVEEVSGNNPDGSRNENEVSGKEINGGTEQTVRAGDWLWIPAGVPHQHWSATQARLMIIKIPNRTA